jgi:holliday junction DNA helicase RuvB
MTQPQGVPAANATTTISGGITTMTRPKSLDEIVGMEHNKKILRYHVVGSKKLGDPLPSFIIVGPAGTGKSTVASIIATYTGGTEHRRSGSDIKSPEDLYDLARVAVDNDIVFIDEAHTIGGGGPKAKICQAILYEWIEDFKLTGGAAFGVAVAPKVCFVLATTDLGKLTKPLQTRCQILHTSYYSVNDIKEILSRAGGKLGLNLVRDDDALTLLAKASRGTPRIAVMQNLDMVRKIMATENLAWSVKTVRHMMQEVGLNEWGLQPNDLLYCRLLYSKIEETGGKPVSKKTMESVTGFTDNYLESVVEGYLSQIGAIRIERGGRVLTEFGYSILGKKPEHGVPIAALKQQAIDVAELGKLLVDPAVRSAGMKGLMHRYGLNYGLPDDRAMFQHALRQAGYIAKRRVGIVPLPKGQK